MSADELVDARLYYTSREVAAAAAMLRANGVLCEVVDPAVENRLPFPAAASPYRLRVPASVTAQVDEILGDKRELAQEPQFDASGSDGLREGVREVSPAEISQGLDLIRRRRRMSWVILLITLPLFLAAALLGKPGLILIAGLMILVTVVHSRLLYTPCPRCGKPFHKVRFGYNVLTRECLHCHLRLAGKTRAV